MKDEEAMADYNSSNYSEQGGAREVIGGSLDVVSGGEIDIESGGALKIAGVAVTADAAELNVMDGVLATAAEINAAADQTAQPAAGIHPLQVAVFTFDASIAANQSIAAHGVGVTLPIHAIVVGGFVDVNTVFHSAGADAGTIAISVEAANDVISAAAVSGAPYSTIGRKAIVPKANTPESTSVKATAAREITCTVAGQVLSAGKLTGYLYFLVGVPSA